jgi:hypothetical protein
MLTAPWTRVQGAMLYPAYLLNGFDKQHTSMQTPHLVPETSNKTQTPTKTTTNTTVAQTAAQHPHTSRATHNPSRTHIALRTKKNNHLATSFLANPTQQPTCCTYPIEDVHPCSAPPHLCSQLCFWRPAPPPIHPPHKNPHPHQPKSHQPQVGFSPCNPPKSTHQPQEPGSVHPPAQATCHAACRADPPTAQASSQVSTHPWMPSSNPSLKVQQPQKPWPSCAHANPYRCTHHNIRVAPNTNKHQFQGAPLGAPVTLRTNL